MHILSDEKITTANPPPAKQQDVEMPNGSCNEKSIDAETTSKTETPTDDNIQKTDNIPMIPQNNISTFNAEDKPLSEQTQSHDTELTNLNNGSGSALEKLAENTEQMDTFKLLEKTDEIKEKDIIGFKVFTMPMFAKSGYVIGLIEQVDSTGGPGNTELTMEILGNNLILLKFLQNY